MELSNTILFIFETDNGTLFSKRYSPGVWRSTDGGLNWVLAVNSPGSIVLTQFGDILIVENLKFHRSQDNGATWTTQAFPAGPTFSQLYATHTGILLAIKNDTLHRSSDGGQSFSSTTIRSTYLLTQLAVLNSGRILLQSSTNLLYSDDDGLSWQTLATLQQGAGGDFVPIAPLGDGTIFKQNLNALLRSSDGGLTWQFSGAGIRAATEIDMKFVSDSLYYALNQIGLWKTGNAGDSWKLMTYNTLVNFNNGYFNHEENFAITPSGGVAAFQNNRLLWSSDFGETFTDITPPPGLASTFHYVFINPLDNTLFVNAGGMYKSTNFGQTWTSTDALGRFHGMAFHPSGRIIANSLTNVLISDNGGNTWSSVPNPSGWNNSGPIASVSPNGTIFISRKDQSLWRSKDVGETWALLPPVLKEGVVGDESMVIASNGHLYVSDGYEDVVLSVDEGATWQTLPEAFSFQRISNIALSPSQRLFAGVYGHLPNLYQSSFPVTEGAYIEGYVKVDADANCSTPDAQAPIKNRIVKAAGESFEYYTSTDSEGHYIFFVDTGSYQVVLQNPSNIWWDYCQDSISVELPELFMKDTVDFAAIPLSFCPLMTVNVGIPQLRQCFDIEAFVTCQDTSLHFNLKNTGNAHSQTLGYIIIEDDVVLMTGQEGYDIAEDLILDFPANGKTWRIESEQEPGHPFSNLALAFAEGCGGFGSLGYINQFQVNGIQPSWHRMCVENIGAFDPNDKQGFPIGVGSEHNIRPGQAIDYLIRFQNTGTGTAFTVVIRDTLSAFLDPISIRAGASSHPYTWSLSGQGVISFRFNNIMLPDSNVNKSASHGFVQFNIAPYADVPLGSVIENNAAIYFDFNTPVITNTTWHTIQKSPLSSSFEPKPKTAQLGLEVWPNPFSLRTNIRLEKKTSGTILLNIFDSRGTPVAQKTATGPDIEFNAKYLPAGLYWAEIRDMQGRLLGNGKLVKE